MRVRDSLFGETYLYKKDALIKPIEHTHSSYNSNQLRYLRHTEERRIQDLKRAICTNGNKILAITEEAKEIRKANQKLCDSRKKKHANNNK